jgi:cytochrome c oxidase subunit 4
MKPTSKKALVGVALIVLAAVSFGASYVHMGHASLPVALGIAAVKATLVGVVFMEIGRERASFKLALLSAAFLIATLLTLVAADVTQRGTPPLPPPSAQT